MPDALYCHPVRIEVGNVMAIKHLGAEPSTTPLSCGEAVGGCRHCAPLARLARPHDGRAPAPHDVQETLVKPVAQTVGAA